MVCFFLNMNTHVTGLNMQACCWNGIIAQLYWNLGTILQGLGRIIRIGQGKEVTWRIIKVNGSYYDIQEDKMCRKFVEVIRNEGHIPSYLTSGPLQRIVAYEQIRVLLSQPFNRYTWCAPGIDPPGTIQEYSDYRHIRLGRFYSTIAKVLMTLPDSWQNDEEMLDRLAYFMSDIAKAFEGTDIDGGDVDKEITLTWITDSLKRIEDNQKSINLGEETGSKSRKRSKKFKSQEIIDDSGSGSDGEGGAEKLLRRKAASKLKHAEKQASVLDMVSSLGSFLNGMKKPELFYGGDKEMAKHPLHTINGLTKKDDKDYLDIERRMQGRGAKK
ncbi:hypothetical protein BJ170DRAFT_269784 [Xylariales sp. AK1849]|nr:hypothetical protein BJ170DRAFT_269784 [Xylariales sp. AK1849]